MSPNPWEEQIQQLRLLTVAMLASAEADAWDAVADGENQRCALLEALSVYLPLDQDHLSPAIAESLQVILATDAHLRTVARAKFAELSDALQSIHTDQRVKNAYNT